MTKTVSVCLRNGDRDVLMREVDPNIIIKVCTAINAASGEAAETLGN